MPPTCHQHVTDMPPTCHQHVTDMSPTCRKMSVLLMIEPTKHQKTFSTKHNIKKLHHNVHSVNGMLGLLDCSHTKWKIAQKHDQVCLRDKKTLSHVLKGIANYHIFLASLYGYAGTLNDKTIFNLSPFQKCLLDGSFEESESRSGVVSFKIENEEFNNMFVLMDSIYMNFT